MALPTREELLALDYPHNGLPFAPVRAKESVSADSTFAGLPFLVLAEGEGGGPPPDPPAHPPTHLAVVASDTPITATTIVRETGDVILSDDGFTLIEETGSPFATPATVYRFQSSTPTSGSWVLGRDYATNAKTDGVLRSPSPVSPGTNVSATLTLVTTAPNTRVTFDWGILGSFYPPDDSDAFHFFIDEVEVLLKYPPDDLTSETRGTYSFVVPAGTYNLRWSFTRPSDFVQTEERPHAWIAALIIDPNF